MRLRRPLLLGVTAAILLTSGAGVATVLTDRLGIRAEAATIPVEETRALGARAYVLPPELSWEIPAGSSRITAASQELSDALDSAAGRVGEATLTVSGGGPGDDERYALSGTAEAIRLHAPTDAGIARGLYDLADQVRTGRPVTEYLGETVTAALPFRMADLGAVGVAANEDEWLTGEDYSHASGAFASAILSQPPWVDADELSRATTTFEEYARHVAAQGFTAIAVPGLIEFLTFDTAGVYADAPDRVEQADAMRAAYRPMFDYAEDLGLKVYLRTDMLTLTTPLQEYLVERFGSLDTTNPQLWQVYTSAMDELYDALPQLDGVVIRIGEAGAIYDNPGLDFFSTLDVTTVDSVRTMLAALAEQAERSGTDVIFRTWTVGVGPVGDLHTNPASYAEVFDGIDSPNLVVSTKYTLGDFYSYLPLNTTLTVGTQRRIVEFQSRREFEGFGAFPNDLGDLYRQALQAFRAANPHLEGVWVWTQDGGPWRAGPMSLELTSGFWQLYELGTELAVDLARDPAADPAEITADWAARWLSADPATIAAISEAMTSSREAITAGLYIRPYAEQKVFAIGLEPPPMMWLFEWDILTGDSAVLSVIYAISRDDLDIAIDDGQRALDAVERMRSAVTVAGTDAASWRPGMHDAFTAALDYQRSTLEVLGAYREYFLRNAQWHDTGSAASHTAWTAALERYRQAAATHLATYTGDVQHPPLNLVAADLGVQRATRDLPMAWAARGLLVLTLLWLTLGIAAHHPRVHRVPGAPAARAMLTAATRPWRAAEAVRDLGREDRILLVAVPVIAVVASRGILTWFAAPVHLLTMLAGWALFVLVVLVAARRLSVWPVVATLGGAALLRVVLLTAALASTGPGGYWFAFWTDPAARSRYVTIAVALLLWTVVAAGWTLAGQLGARRAVGIALTGVGVVIAGIAAVVGRIGAETALTVWNDQLGLLPWGLSRILGITVYLGIPAGTPWYAAGVGAVLLIGGLALALPGRTRDAAGAAG